MTLFTAGAGTQTIPLWVLAAMQRPTQLPVVNVVALVLVLLSVDPRLPRSAHRAATPPVGDGTDPIVGCTCGPNGRRLGACARPTTRAPDTEGSHRTVSATVRSTAGVSAWRVAVIGLVGRPRRRYRGRRRQLPAERPGLPRSAPAPPTFRPTPRSTSRCASSRPRPRTRRSVTSWLTFRRSRASTSTGRCTRR